MTHQFLQRCIIVKNNLLELRFFCPDILPNRRLVPLILPEPLICLNSD
jgi:hypothetical protein